MKLSRIAIIAILSLAFISMPTMVAYPSTTIQSVINVPAMKAGHGYIELSVPGDEAISFAIYSITGQSIKTITISGTMKVELPRGYYIVRCDQWSKTVVVK
ncbi:MAG: hypothetical protein E7081_07340 [Bacteroidales bacterium]|nr:hypothetical protein [Bacteroidales bacterium]